MADVKFMDLSQNDNPALTDSVLIGNSTDGLKRTSVEKIIKLASASTDNLFHFEEVVVNNDLNKPNPGSGDDNNSSISITAPNVAGYNFAFWLEPSTQGSIWPSYIDHPSQPQARLWLVFPNQVASAVTVVATAVYVKSTIG